MAKGQWTSKVGSGAAVPMALTLAVLFFLPWVNVTCSGTKVGSATGLQLSVGKMTVNNPFGEDGPAKKTGGAKEEDKKDPKARPWFFLGLIVPLLVLAAAGMGLAGKMTGPAAGMAIAMLGVLGLLTAILATQVDYKAEMTAEPPKMQPKGGDAKNPDEAMGQAMGQAMGEAFGKKMAEEMPIRTEATGGLVTTIVLYALLLAAGAVNLVLPGMMAKMRAAGAGNPPIPPPPPPA